VLSAVRSEPGLGLEQAARRFGTTPESVVWWAPGVVAKSKDTWTVRPADRLYRAMRIHSGRMTIDIDVRGSRKASLLAAHHDAVRHYLATGDIEALDPFIGKSVGGHRLETNVDTLDEMARRGSLDIETIYQLAGS